jgi:CRISPR/Cas system endoribonuclease Cas6 (RAMP superfamily)
MARDSKQTNRVVTLSPLTLMAKNFHEKNGAVRIGLNPETQNFEYSLKDTRWEKYMKDAKKWFGLHVG